MMYSDMNQRKRPVSASAVVRIIIWSVVFCIFTGLFAVSLADDLFQLDWAGIPSFVSTVIRYDDDDYSVGNGKSEAAVTALSVEWVAGSVTVVPAEGNEVTVTEDYNGEDEKMRLRWKIEDGVLSVKFCKPTRFGRNDMAKKSLTVAIPAAMLEAMGTVDIVGVDCDITFKGNADELSLEAVKGALTVEGDIGTLDVEAVDGHVIFRGGVRDADVECVNADVTMHLDMAAELDFDEVNGDVQLYLSEAVTGFTVERDSLGGGVVTEGFDGVDRTRDTVRWGNQSLRIRIDAVNAQLKIEKATKD